MLVAFIRRALATGGALLCLALLVPAGSILLAQTSGQGRWRTVMSSSAVPLTVPINPVHVALMNNGKVLIVAGSGNVATETNFQAAVWDPQWPNT